MNKYFLTCEKPRFCVSRLSRPLKFQHKELKNTKNIEFKFSNMETVEVQEQAGELAGESIDERPLEVRIVDKVRIFRKSINIHA
jgi:hypothetical protein